MPTTQQQQKVILETVKPMVDGKKKGQTVKREFDYEDAKNLLKYEKAMKVKEWQLPKDSPYQIDNNGDLIPSGSLEVNKGAQASKGNPSGEGKEDQA
jgi:hypothetical protein